jgi:hypothetical protein
MINRAEHPGAGTKLTAQSHAMLRAGEKRFLSGPPESACLPTPRRWAGSSRQYPASSQIKCRAAVFELVFLRTAAEMKNQDLDGHEVPGGTVVMRTGENAREVIRRVKA